VVAPAAANIRVNENTSGATVVHAAGFVNLKFNSLINADQLPMTAYFVDWGDGQTSSFTGIEVQNRPNPANPHTLYHHVSYWDLLQRSQTGTATITCGTGNGIDFCRVRPRVQIRDKWGWCNGRTPTEAFFSTACLTTPNAWADSGVVIEVQRE
jgi:hypothetical protein